MKKSKPSKRLPKKAKSIIDLIQTRTFGYDRITVWFDHSDPDIPRKKLESLCLGDVIPKLGSAPFQQHWKSKVTLFQPQPEALLVLSEWLRNSQYQTRLSEIEIACDFITKRKKHATQMLAWLLGHLYLRYHRTRVICSHKVIFYFHRRHDSRGHKTGKVFVLYADKKSKLPGSTYGCRCCHIECRLFDNQHLEPLGLYTVDDLIEFDHLAFWTDTVQFARWSSKADLGRKIYPGTPNVSGAALRQHANNFIAEYRVEGAFVLQNALLEDRSLLEITEPIDTDAVFKGSQ